MKKISRPVWFDDNLNQRGYPADPATIPAMRAAMERDEKLARAAKKASPTTTVKPVKFGTSHAKRTDRLKQITRTARLEKINQYLAKPLTPQSRAKRLAEIKNNR